MMRDQFSGTPMQLVPAHLRSPEWTVVTDALVRAMEANEAAGKPRLDTPEYHVHRLIYEQLHEPEWRAINARRFVDEQRGWINRDDAYEYQSDG